MSDPVALRKPERAAPSQPSAHADLPESPGRAVTLRAVLWGLGVVAFVNWWMAHCEYVVRASRLNGSHFPVALVAAMAALLFVVWPVLRITGRRGFTTLERRVVLLMGLVGAAIPANGLTGFLLGVIATPYYYATPENNWASFHPYIPAWIVPPDTNRAMRWFFNGLPPGESIPWGVWLVPLFWWMTLVAAIVGLCLALAIILRRQWVEHERLAYPLVEAGLALVAGKDDPEGRRPLYRSRLFWLGTSLTLGILVWNAIAWVAPSLPLINILGRGMQLFRGVPDFQTRLNFLTIGLSYFAPQQMLGSLLLGFLLCSVEVYAFNRVGMNFGAPGDSWSNNDVPTAWQSFGAMVVFVAWFLWQARRHLARVARDAWAGRDNGREMLSPRAAGLAFAVSTLYAVLWFHAAGMDWPFAIMFVGMAILGYLALGRMIAEAGFVYQRVPLSPQTVTVFSLGVDGFSPGTMTAFAFSYSLIANGRGLFMPAIVQSVRIADGTRGDQRRAFGAIVLAFAVGLAVSIVVTLWYGYEYGAYNFRVYPFSGGNQEAFGHTIRKIENPFGSDWARLSMGGIGAFVMSGLMAIRYRFPGFPIHPIGFVFPFTYLTRFAATSFFVAWAAKSLLLGIGGVRLYRRAQPLFLGLAVGYSLGVAFSYVVDVIWFPGAGHGFHSW